MKLEFTFKRVYGNPKFYPDNKAAMVLCALTERICLGKDQFIEVLKLRKLGAEIEVSDSTSSEKLSGPKLIEILGL